MGRRTYEDMLEQRGDPPAGSPLLPNRDCVVLSRKKEFEPKGVIMRPGLREAIQESDPSKNLFVIGGERVFWEALPWTTRIYMTVIDDYYQCDQHFPLKYVVEHFTLRSGEKFAERHMFVLYERTKK
jgi:dihydrofolate reductase